MHTSNKPKKEVTFKNDRVFRKGEQVLYKGQEASVVEVKPVLTIRIKGEVHVVCGNILNDVKHFKR
jgi:hypothetical protein